MKKLFTCKSLILVALVACVLIFFLFLIRGDEDTWICKDGRWIEHGHPSSSMPSIACINKEEINNFEECVSAGNAVMESYPRQCRSDEKTFVENIGNELEKNDLIRVENPRPNQFIENQLLIKGEARGTWYFEASFPIFLYDNNGKEIAISIAQAKSDWMTENFVSFEAVLEFSTPETNNGFLIFKKDNPSGLSEYDDELKIPVKFSK